MRSKNHIHEKNAIEFYVITVQQYFPLNAQWMVDGSRTDLVNSYFVWWNKEQFNSGIGFFSLVTIVDEWINETDEESK